MEPTTEDLRLRALAAYRLLGGDHPRSGATDVGTAPREPEGREATDLSADIGADIAALTRLASVVTGLPIASLNLFDATHQVQLSAVGAPAGISPREDSPCAGHFQDGRLVHVPDASRDPRFAANPYVDGRLGAIRAYASAPLVNADGYALGTLCAADTRPRDLTETQVAALDDLSRVVLSLFERRRQAHVSARLAAEADEQRQLAELLIVEAGHRSRLVDAVFDSVGVGIVVADAQGHLVTLNATAETWLGRPADPRLPLTGHAQHYDLRTADGSQPMPTHALPLHRALLEGPVDEIEMVIAAPDRRPRAVVCSARPLLAEDGTAAGAVAALHDVSTLRAREAALQSAHRELGRHAEQSAAVARATRAVITAHDPRQAICDAVRELTGADAAFLLQPHAGLLQPHEGRLVSTATSGLHPGAVFSVDLTTDGEHGAQPRPSLAATAHTSGEFLFVPDVAADPRHDAAMRTACETVSGAWQPIAVHEGSSTGVLAVVWRHRVEALSASTRAMLGTLAGEAAHAIERAALLAKLADAADHDPLTELANRRSWDRSVDRETARAQRTDAPLSLLLIDLDHFKAYNDAHGHLAGDGLLRAFAVSAADCLREVDVLARWGGEEFAVALPGCSGPDAVVIADRIRRCVPAAQTATIGVAQRRPGESGTQALARADEALYRGKRAGRDRTVLCP